MSSTKASGPKMLMVVDAIDPDGLMHVTIHPKYLKDILAYVPTRTEYFRSDGSVVLNGPWTVDDPLRLAISESGHAPYLEGSALRQNAAYHREIEQLSEMLHAANRELRALKAVKP